MRGTYVRRNKWFPVPVKSALSNHSEMTHQHKEVSLNVLGHSQKAQKQH